jgi:large subunit ribosomal protein L14
MKGLQSKVPKGLTIGSRMLCDDNSGAKIVQIIGVKGSHSKRTRTPSVGVGDLVIVAVKKGVPQMKKKVGRAVIIRQKRGIRRAGGMRVEFEDNAVVLVDEQGLPKGTEIKGAIAREVVDRFPKIAGISSAVV